MSAAQAVLVQSSPFLEVPAPVPSADQVLRELIHDLRQPLSSIEAIAYYLEMTLPPDQQAARLYVHRIQELVNQSSSILDGASTSVRKRAAVAGTL